jgi:hypothetical protein
VGHGLRGLGRLAFVLSCTTRALPHTRTSLLLQLKPWPRRLAVRVQAAQERQAAIKELMAQLGTELKERQGEARELAKELK